MTDLKQPKGGSSPAHANLPSASAGSCLAQAFVGDDFLLGGKAARRLYFEIAQDLPVIDFHSHIRPEWIGEDRSFSNIAELMLHDDHYKWRAMRTAGIPERFITGDATDWEKFLSFATALPLMLRNPIYHWTHMELAGSFGISDRLLSENTAAEIWEQTAEQLKHRDSSARGIVQRYNVEVLCTTDDPTDDLAHHAKCRLDATWVPLMLPTFRPDRALAVDDTQQYNAWVNRLAASSDVDITDYDSLIAALRVRAHFFNALGCRASDHGLNEIHAIAYRDSDIRVAFAKVRQGRDLTPAEAAQLKSSILHDLGAMYHELGWVMQLHVGAMRNNNTRFMHTLGPDTGFDCIGDLPLAQGLLRFLDALDVRDQLPRSIVYNINPADNELTATALGCFQDGSRHGKMQLGSAWWFLDQQDGITKQLNAVSNMGLLGCFVGMVTDSRSLLSYSRHDYFRRVLCDLLGGEMERGLLPYDFTLVGDLVARVCYENAREYFCFERPDLAAGGTDPVGVSPVHSGPTHESDPGVAT